MSALTDRLVLAGRQCPKRLWLEVHHSGLREESTDATRLADRREVRAAARQLLDPQGLAQRPGAPDDEQAAAETMRLLRDGVPVLDAVIDADGVRTSVDALLPFPDKSQKHQAKVHAALCRQAIETSASGVEGIAPVTPKPVYFDLDIEAAARIVEQTGQRLGHRLEAAHVGIDLLREQLGLPLPRGVRRPSVNEFSRKLFGFRKDGWDEGNFKNRVLGL